LLGWTARRVGKVALDISKVSRTEKPWAPGRSLDLL